MYFLCLCVYLLSDQLFAKFHCFVTSVRLAADFVFVCKIKCWLCSYLVYVTIVACIILLSLYYTTFKLASYPARPAAQINNDLDG